MTAYRTQPPWEFLLTASRNTLQSYELSRLSHAANLRKEIASLIDAWIEENSAAMLARWLIEQRQRTVVPPDDDAAPEPFAGNGHAAAQAAGHCSAGTQVAAQSVSDNFLADRFVPPHVSRGRA